VLTILFIATLVHASLGFGTALVAMPLLVLVLGLYTATPLVALVVVITISVLLIREWRHMEVRSAWQLLAASVFGIPIGLLLLRAAPDYLVKSILGVVLIAYSVYNLTRPRLPKISRGPLVYVFGFLAGVLGGAYNTNGPPVVLYGALSRWSPAQFRATVQGYFLPTAVLVCAGHAAAGLWSTEVFKLFAFAVPVVLIGNLAGIRLARRIPAERFTQILYAVLIALGALMFV
jgi:uncharacterized protein